MLGKEKNPCPIPSAALEREALPLVTSGLPREGSSGDVGDAGWARGGAEPS